VTTFHASNCDDAINRLVEIGIPNYACETRFGWWWLSGWCGGYAIGSQPADVQHHARGVGLNVENCRIAGACDDCHQTGYAGRCLIADYRTMNELQGDAAKKGDEPLWASAIAAC